jgi:3'-5' exoribonuclease
MPARSIPILTLDRMTAGQEADLFLLLVARDELPTRDGKRYLRVTFRDATGEIGFPIWNDAPLAEECRTAWRPGTFYKVRGIYRESHYGPQLDIQRIREVTPADEADGFDPSMCRARSRHDPQEMFAQLVAMAQQQIGHPPVRGLVLDLLEANRDALLKLPAAERNHHSYGGGWLEHTLATTRTVLFLADQYLAAYPDLQPPLDRDLLVAGAMVHDIGKVRELNATVTGAETTAAGHLLGHIVQGRDMVREAAVDRELDAEWLLRLEHLMLAHQGSAEHGSPVLPMTPEAMLVHFADDIDAKFHMLYVALRDDTADGPVTSKKNVLMRAVYRGTRG